jgi:hypothetical protein
LGNLMTLTVRSVRILAIISAALLSVISIRALRAQPQGGVIGVKRIDIEASAWNGQNTIRQKLVIRATDKGYSAGNRKVASDLVRELLARLDSPPQTLGLAALGIDRGWLRQHGFDEARFLEAVNRYYKDSVVLDVDAGFALEIVQVDGSRIRVRSLQSHAYMVPWKITTQNREFDTYSVGVSKAIMRLLPEGFLNSSLIGGRPHGRDFSYEIGAVAEPLQRW